jgi:hypothetical protein
MFDKVWKIFLMVVVTGLLVGGVGYWATREKKRDLGPALYLVADNVSRQFSQSIPVESDVNHVLFLVVQRRDRDEEVKFRGMLTEDVKEKAQYHVKTWDDVIKMLPTVSEWIMKNVPGVAPNEPPDTIEDARKAVRFLAVSNVKIDGVLLARVTQFEQGDHGLGSRITIEGEFHNLKTGKQRDLPKVTDGIDSSMDYRYLSNRIAEMSFFGRFLAWFVVAAGVPFLLKAPIAALTSKRRNELNATLLGGLTLFDVFLGWVLIVALGYGWGSVLVLALLAAGMGWYNHDAVEYIDTHLR